MRVFLIISAVTLSLVTFVRCGTDDSENKRTQTAKTITELTQQAAVDENCMRITYGKAIEELAAGLIKPKDKNRCRLVSFKVMVKGQEADRFCLVPDGQPNATNLTYTEYKNNRENINCPDACEEGASVLPGGCPGYTAIFCNECEVQE